MHHIKNEAKYTVFRDQTQTQLLFTPSCDLLQLLFKSGH